MIWRPDHPEGLVWKCLYVDQRGIRRVAGTVWRMGPSVCPTWQARVDQIQIGYFRTSVCSSHTSMRHAAKLVEDRCADIVFEGATAWDGGPR